MADEEETNEVQSSEAEGEVGKETVEEKAEPVDSAPGKEVEEEVKAEEPKAEVKAEEPKAEKKEVSAKFKDLVEKIEKLTVLELAELVKELEERFGVSAAAPMMMAGPSAGGAAAEPVEEKTSFDVVLSGAGAQKIAVIKAVREIKPELGLVDAKNLVEAAPKELLKGVKKEEADAAKAKLEAAGATVEIK